MKNKIIWKPQVTATIMLIAALNPGTPYDYYVLLRWLMCGIFAYLSFRAFESKNTEWVLILGITAVVYNPFLPWHLGREIWTIVNLLTIGIAITSIFKLKGKNE
jgi:hypothetical protein